jgi:hypothetical protein
LASTYSILPELFLVLHLDARPVFSTRIAVRRTMRVLALHLDAQEWRPRSAQGGVFYIRLCNKSI